MTTNKIALSLPRQKLIELMQEIQFGRIEGLEVRNCEPILAPAPRLLRDILFGKANAPHAARGKADFVLKDPIVELFQIFERERSLTIDSLVVQNGLPVRMTVSACP